MLKTYISIYIDKQIYLSAKEQGLNISFICNNALKDAILKNDAERLKEISRLKARIKELENSTTINKPSDPEPKKQEVDINIVINREIEYFPSFIRRGFLSTPTKRDKFYRLRAKTLNMDLSDYLEKIVNPADKKLLGKR